MKILGIHSVWGEDQKTSAVDIWRIYRPLEMLKIKTDWQIDYQPAVIPNIGKHQNKGVFDESEIEKAAKILGSYDIVFTSYFYNAAAYALLKAVKSRYATEYVIDIDDDIFAINPDNPVWLKIGDEDVYRLQCMARDADNITTTTDKLAEVLRSRRLHSPDTVTVLPNYISDDYPQRKPASEVSTIGYFGGGSHFRDLDTTGVIPAVERIMHENRNIRFVSCGVPIEQYLPRGRYTYLEGKRGLAWTKEMFPSLRFDICLAPLAPTIFAESKSNIKWQEATRMGAALIASKIGPYKELTNAVLVNNTAEEWYNAIRNLIDSPTRRLAIINKATQELQSWTLEANIDKYIKYFEGLRRKDANY